MEAFLTGAFFAGAFLAAVFFPDAVVAGALTAAGAFAAADSPATVVRVTGFDAGAVAAGVFSARSPGLATVPETAVLAEADLTPAEDLMAAAAAGFLFSAGLAAALSVAVFVFGALEEAVFLDAEVAGLEAVAPAAGFFACDVAGEDVLVPVALDAAGLRDTGFFAGDFGAPPLVSSVIFLKLQSSLDPPSATIITGSAQWEHPLGKKRTGCAFLNGLTDFYRSFKT